MFWRHRSGKDGKDKFGRTFDEAWREHASWCLDTFKKNEPDDIAKMNYIFNNSPTHVGCPVELRKHLSGNAVYNAYLEIKMHFKSFKKYYTQEEIDSISYYFEDNTE